MQKPMGSELRLKMAAISLLNYESGKFVINTPVALRAESTRYMAEVGRYLIERLHYYRRAEQLRRIHRHLPVYSGERRSRVSMTACPAIRAQKFDRIMDA